ncbi:hypothetical protein HB364_28730 [Pseudoflavitalea sp. X16]|uniref:tetratricopeptide repeat protein n=1 Tax=Paraflavitalea devenefica TaxID=2716334 RepID=UPI001423C9FF|nr:hypothetical protein [Paraflavitalea devenefica]NII29099.1 hypothetical protein [Paraflavitalea devenefica]
MSYYDHNGHSTMLTEPNGPALSEVTPVSKKAKTVIKETETDDIDALIATMEIGEATTEAITEMEEGITEVPIPAAIPTPIIPFPKNRVYGRYRALLGAFELELRIDTDGPGPLQKVSGDYYQIIGQTKSYFGSFIVDSLTKNIANGVITLTGIANTTWATSFKKLKVSIKQSPIFQPLAPALLQWFHATTNAPGALYVCNHIHRAFRTVRLEQDCTAGVTPFVSYNTGSLPSGGPARILSVTDAFKEAGVDMINAGLGSVVPMVNITPPADRWSNAELHRAMIQHFSLYRPVPQWNVWLLHAYEHEYGPGLYGIMFDQEGLQRQGCAVFYRGIGGLTAEQKRLQLYTCIHELGHCFNLLHSFQKNLAIPPKPNIPNSLSWMNYPQFYPGGAAAFWSAFPFQFDAVEVAHIRHGFRNNVLMGGNPFRVGASLEETGNIFEDNIENHTSLYMELEAKKSYLLGEPVCLETQLKTSSNLSTQVMSNLHADFGFVTIGIKKPGGKIMIYKPVTEMCAEPTYTVLNASNPAIYESSYIGYSKEGFIFDEIGNYQVKAVYYHTDGSRIVSNTLNIRIKSPVTAQDDAAAELLFEDQVGYLMSFMGSDAEYLQKGNDALQLLVDKYRDHPLTIYAQFVRGVNAQRAFKTITADKKLYVREANYQSGEDMLREAIEKSKGDKGLDNISLNQAMQILAKTYYREGNKEAANAVAGDMINYFSSLPIKEHVKEKIRRQSATLFTKE